MAIKEELLKKNLDFEKECDSLKNQLIQLENNKSLQKEELIKKYSKVVDILEQNIIQKELVMIFFDF